jgi:uncharacterized protein YukE
MGYGDQQIGLDDITGTADLIDQVVGQLQEAQQKANTRANDLVNGAWKTPKASATFDAKWREWNSGMKQMIEVGPEFANWLRKYAKDAELLDTTYGQA